MNNSWRCEYVDSHGEQCNNIAELRIHFAKDHPFDHIHVCCTHAKLFSYVWAQNLID